MALRRGCNVFFQILFVLYGIEHYFHYIYYLEILYDGLLAMLEYLCDCFFTCCVRIKHHYTYYFNAMLPGLRAPSENSQSACWLSVLITLMAVADYFGLHCCRQQVHGRVGDTGTGYRNLCQYQACARVPMQ